MVVQTLFRISWRDPLGGFVAFFPPTFPLFVNVWRNGNPVTNPPDVVAPCNMTPGGRVVLTPVASSEYFFFLLPALSDVRGVQCAGGADTLEFPPATGRFYTVVRVDDVAKGFANEHRVVYAVQSGVWPAPIP